jgi:uncharacterized membrane protein
MMLLPLHIVAGAIGIASGFVALYALKGARLHRKSGMLFVCAMLVMSGTGAVMAALKSQTGSVIGGLLTFYLVTTALLTVRRRDPKSHWVDAGALLVALTVAVLAIQFGLDTLSSATRNIDGMPAAPSFVFATVALLAALGDIRMMLAPGLRGAHRIARHLWRMCFAMFIATGSFFLGQAKVFPEPIRIIPLLAIPVLLVLVLMIYWLARVLLTPWYRRAHASFGATSLRGSA